MPALLFRDDSDGLSVVVPPVAGGEDVGKRREQMDESPLRARLDSLGWLPCDHCDGGWVSAPELALNVPLIPSELAAP